MESLLVSVIIPTHNRAQRLERAIHSVLAQTYRNLEVIVVDDASNDRTAAVVRSFKDPRIRYFRHERNRGGSAARNTGIQAATGDYIAFLDDDDEWLPHKTAEQLALLKDHAAVVCATTDGNHGEWHARGKETLDLEDLKRGPWGGTGVLMGRSQAIKEVLFDEDLPLGQDWDFFIRLAQAHRIAYLDKALLRYDGGGHPRLTNARRNMRPREVEEQLRVVRKHRQLFGDAWYKRQMCTGMLYGFKDRKDKISLLYYAARRYGAGSVVRALAVRARARFAKTNMATGRDNGSGSRAERSAA